MRLPVLFATVHPATALVQVQEATVQLIRLPQLRNTQAGGHNGVLPCRGVNGSAVTRTEQVRTKMASVPSWGWPRLRSSSGAGLSPAEIPARWPERRQRRAPARARCDTGEQKPRTCMHPPWPPESATSTWKRFAHPLNGTATKLSITATESPCAKELARRQATVHPLPVDPPMLLGMTQPEAHLVLHELYRARVQRAQIPQLGYYTERRVLGHA
jgi:hypothetical protein